MQAQRADNDEVSHVLSPLVGARGANAAQRARDLQLAPVPAPLEQSEADPQSPADLPSARRSGSAGADVAGPAVSDAAPVPRRRRRKLALIGAVAAVVLGVGGWFGFHYVTVGRYLISTDDAYVRADTTTLAAKVAGYVSTIAVGDNSLVHAGDVIARIDDGDYQLAADAARDKAATQQATIGRIGQQIAAAQAAVVQARAQLASARAVETRTESELKRQQALAAKAFASRQTLEQAQSNRDQAVAAVQSAQAAIASAVANVGVLEAQQQEAERQLNELKTAEAKAERDLSFTVIRAPVDGIIGNRAMQVGDYVQPGQRLAALVPLDDVYIDANFKETQVANSAAGPKGRGQRRRPAQPRSDRHGRQHVACFRLRLLAAAAGQRHRQLHQDRAAAGGAHPPACRRHRPPPAAARHVGGGEREYQIGRNGRRQGRVVPLHGRRGPAEVRSVVSPLL